VARYVAEDGDHTGVKNVRCLHRPISMGLIMPAANAYIHDLANIGQ